MLAASLLSLLVLITATTAAQRPLVQQFVDNGQTYSGIDLPGSDQAYDAGLFTPLEEFSLLSTSEFTTLSHPLFPNYNVRIKKSDFCDGTVGYTRL